MTQSSHRASPPPGCPAHAGPSGPPGSPGNPPIPLYGPDFAADPGRVYERLRQYGACAPVELAPGASATLVTSYHAALHVLRSTETFGKDARRWRALADGRVTPDNPVVPMMVYRPNCLYAEGDAHRRLRGAVEDSLDRIDPNALRGYVESVADTLIDRFATAGRADLVGDYAKVLPLQVLNRLFGCPKDVGDRMVQAMAGIFDGVDAERANAQLTAALLELIALKRRQPGADVTSWLMTHQARLNDEEMCHQLVVLMGAGVEPQQNLVVNGLRLLLSDERFAGSLNGGSLPVEDALDEVLWTDPPMANYGVHYPFYDVDLEGTRLYAGEPVAISFAAANNDPALASDQRAGNRAHLAWSAGPHACPAQSAARLIAAVAIEKLLDRLPDMELAVPADQLTWRPGPFHRALTALPVRFPPVAVPLRAAEPQPVAVPVPVTLGASASHAQTPGDSRWNPSTARPAPSTPSFSTLPETTSTARQPGSPASARRSVWSFLVRWWRGR